MNRVVLHIVAIMFLPIIASAQTTLNELAEHPEANPVVVTAELSNTGGIHAGDIFQWDVMVRWDNNQLEITPEIKMPPQLKNAEPINTSTLFRSGGDDGGMYSETVFRYTFKALDEGDTSIGSIQIAYENEDGAVISVNTETLQLTVLPERVSLLKMAITIWNLLWVKIALIVLILLGLCVTCFMAFRTPKQDEPVVDPDQTDPVEETMNLARAKRVEGDHKTYFAKLEDAVRLRLNQAHPGVSSTNLSDFCDAISPDKKIVFERFLHECQEAKYAPVSPSTETLDRAWDDVQRIVGNS